MTALQSHAEKYLFKALPAFGFAMEPNNKACDLFMQQLRDVIKYICSRMQSRIERQFLDSGNVHTLDDIVSWANSDLRDIIFKSIGGFWSKVDNLEILSDGGQKVRCEQALTHFHLLRREISDSVKYFDDMRKIKPQSKRFQKKRAGRPWRPYFGDLFDDE